MGDDKINIYKSLKDFPQCRFHPINTVHHSCYPRVDVFLQRPKPVGYNFFTQECPQIFQHLSPWIFPHKWLIFHDWSKCEAVCKELTSWFLIKSQSFQNIIWSLKLRIKGFGTILIYKILVLNMKWMNLKLLRLWSIVFKWQMLVTFLFCSRGSRAA